jgi:hypothetical protein
MDDDELTPEQKFAMDDPADKVHFDLAHGRDREEIFADLVYYGWSARAAEKVIDRAAQDLGMDRASLANRRRQVHGQPQRYQNSTEEHRRLVREAKRQMFAGILVSLLALFIGVLTLWFALDYGGFTLFPIGLFFAGLMVFRRGHSRWRACRDLEPSSPDGRVPRE